MFIILYFLPYLVYSNYIKYLPFCCFYFFLSPPYHSLSFLYSTFSLSFPSIPLGYSKQVVMYHSAVLPMFFFHRWQCGSNLWQFSWLIILSYEIPNVKHCVYFYKKYISLTDITHCFMPRSQVIRRWCPYHKQHCLFEMWETYKSIHNFMFKIGVTTLT